MDAAELTTMEHVGFKEIPPDELVIDEVNERTSNVGLHTEEDEALKESIRENGIYDTVIAREKNGTYHVVAGQRRTLAAQKVGVDTVPVRVMEMDDQEARMVSITENAAKFDKDVPLEDRANTVKKLVESDLSEEDIANEMGISEQTLDRWLEPARNYWEDTRYEAKEAEDSSSALERIPDTALPIIRKNTKDKERRERIADNVVEYNVNVNYLREAASNCTGPKEFEKHINKIIQQVQSGTTRIQEEVRLTGEVAERVKAEAKNRGISESDVLEMLVKERLEGLKKEERDDIVEIYLPRDISEPINDMIEGTNATREALCRQLIKSKLEKNS